MKALWNNVIIADSEKTIEVEGNHYFPLDSINEQFFSESSHTTTCGWKGLANYFNIEVEGKVNLNAAWLYKTPSTAASQIKDHVAFWKGVIVN